jgi:hypothetical protein
MKTLFDALQNLKTRFRFLFCSLLFVGIFSHNLRGQCNPDNYTGDPSQYAIPDCRPNPGKTYGSMIGINAGAVWSPIYNNNNGNPFNAIAGTVRSFHDMGDAHDYNFGFPRSGAPAPCPPIMEGDTECHCWTPSGPPLPSFADWQCRYYQWYLDGNTEIHAALMSIANRPFPDNGWFSACEWGNTLPEVYDNAYAYATNFAMTFGPKEPNTVCLVKVVEIGNEPWGQPGRDAYHMILNAFINAFSVYYESTNPEDWRIKLSAPALQAFSQNPVWHSLSAKCCDQYQNGDEIGIDCGGTSGNCSSPLEPCIACESAQITNCEIGNLAYDPNHGTGDIIGEMIPAEAWDFLEGANIHPYSFQAATLELTAHPESNNSEFQRIRNMHAFMEECGLESQNLNITEIGWDSGPLGAHPVGLYAQAVYIVRAILMAGRFGASQAIIYECVDNPFIDDTGLYRSSGLYTATNETPNYEDLTPKDPKPSYHAVVQCMREIGDKEFLKSLTQEVDEGAYAYLLGNSDGLITHLVAWHAIGVEVNAGVTNLQPFNIQLPDNVSMLIPASGTLLDGSSNNAGYQIINSHDPLTNTYNLNLSSAPILIEIINKKFIKIKDGCEIVSACDPPCTDPCQSDYEAKLTCSSDLAFTEFQRVEWEEPTFNETCCAVQPWATLLRVDDNPAEGTTWPAGVYTVTYELWIGCELKETCSFTVTIGNTNCILDPGTIASDESGSLPYDPAPIVSISAPSGNNNIYQWQFSADGTNWQPTFEPGFNQPAYDPGLINVTTYFRRCVKREGCNVNYYSNIVVKSGNGTIPPCPPVDHCAGSNLWCFGDFENFPPVAGGGQTQIGLPVCQPNHGSPVLDVCNGNIYYSLAGFETLELPLSVPIKTGCTLTIKAKIAGSNRKFSILAGSVTPCEAFGGVPCTSGDPLDCGVLTCGNSGSYTCEITASVNSGGLPYIDPNAACDDPLVTTYLGNACELHDNAAIITSKNEPCWQEVEYTLINDGQDNWNYIAFTGNIGEPVLFIDDLELTTKCGCADALSGEEAATAETTTESNAGAALEANSNDPCEVPWEIICSEEENYFCIVDPDGNSYVMEWTQPVFANPNGNCQSISDLTPGQPIQFILYSYPNGVKCPYKVNTTFQCGSNDDCACTDPIASGNNNGGKRNWVSTKPDNFQMSLVPNPANNTTQLTVVCPQEIIGSISIYDITGKLVAKQRINLPAGKSTQLISLGQLGSGNYSVELTDSFKIRLGLEKLIVVRE